MTIDGGTSRLAVMRYGRHRCGGVYVDGRLVRACTPLQLVAITKVLAALSVEVTYVQAKDKGDRDESSFPHRLPDDIKMVEPN